MEIKFEKALSLKEKPDSSTLGFGKIFTDYMFMMDYSRKRVGTMLALYPLQIFHYTLHQQYYTMALKFLRGLRHTAQPMALFSFSDLWKIFAE